MMSPLIVRVFLTIFLQLSTKTTVTANESSGPDSPQCREALKDTEHHFRYLKNISNKIQTNCVHGHAVHSNNFIGQTCEQDLQQLDLLHTQVRRKSRISKLKCDIIPEIRCPGYFHPARDGLCYQVLQGQSNFDAAQLACRGQLAVVEDELADRAVFEIVRDYLIREPGGCGCLPGQFCEFLIGAERNGTDNCWRDFTWKFRGSITKPFTYTNWLSGEPNCGDTPLAQRYTHNVPSFRGQAKENCVAYVHRDTQHGWNDVRCNMWSKCAICQMNPL